MAQRIGQKAFNWMYEQMPEDVKSRGPIYCPAFFYMEDEAFIEKFMDEVEDRAKEMGLPIPSEKEKIVKICPVDTCKSPLKERQKKGCFFEMYCPKCGGAKIYWERQNGVSKEKEE